MKPWHVGQKVVCVNTSSLTSLGSLDPNLIQDKIYTILGISSCKGCNDIVLDVGVGGEESGFFCFCGFANYRSDPVRWCSERRFIPLDDYTNMETEINERLQPVKEEKK